MACEFDSHLGHYSERPVIPAGPHKPGPPGSNPGLAMSEAVSGRSRIGLISQEVIVATSLLTADC